MDILFFHCLSMQVELKWEGDNRQHTYRLLSINFFYLFIFFFLFYQALSFLVLFQIPSMTKCDDKWYGSTVIAQPKLFDFSRGKIRDKK